MEIIDLKIIEVKNSDAHFLYNLLLERSPKANISHKKMPSYKNHVSFVKSKPYSKWYVVVNNKKKIGSIYLTNLNEIAISMKKDFDKNQIKENIIKLLMTKNPRKRYLFNVSPKNTNTINFFKKNSFKLVQYTFELEL